MSVQERDGPAAGGVRVPTRREVEERVAALVASVGRDRTRLLDVLRGVNEAWNWIPDEAVEAISRGLGVPQVEVEGLATFYHFFSRKPRGEIVIRVSDCVPCRMKGAEQVLRRFSELLGVEVGGTTPDGRFTLERTSCIGLCDQGPAALVGDLPVVHLTERKVERLVSKLSEHGLAALEPELLPCNPPVARVHALVDSTIRYRGPFVFGDMEPGSALKRALELGPEAVIGQVKSAGLCGRGGAGFPTGVKWELARRARGERKFVIANADEGEPGTFKDRVLLTEAPHRVLEGMTVAAYAVGAHEGLLYLRAEYAYLLPVIERAIEERRARSLLGRDILGSGFDFDLRVQVGAGAYICGEESALIESAEGKRGAPRSRPPFPVERGYLGFPTVVNNVETLAGAADLVFRGVASIGRLGEGRSCGTKLFSVSGDCERPGVYELPFGIALRDLLELVGAEEAQAVQVGGPSGRMVGRADFGRRLRYEDLATGGSIIVFGPGRDLLEVVSHFLAFFAEESCGWCVPCRAGTVTMKQLVDRIRAGRAVAEDLENLENLARAVRTTSRCGLGQTAPNPVLSSLEAFRSLWESRLLPGRDRGRQPAFELDLALAESRRLQGDPRVPGEGA